MSTQLLIPTDFILFSKLSSVNFSKSVKKRRIYDNLLCFERHPLFSKKNHSTKNLRLFHMPFHVIVSQEAACLLHIMLFSINDRIEEKVDELGLGGGVEIPTLKVCRHMPKLFSYALSSVFCLLALYLALFAVTYFDLSHPLWMQLRCRPRGSSQMSDED